MNKREEMSVVLKEEVEYDLDLLSSVIHDVIKIHSDFCKVNCFENPFNLRKTQVKTVLSRVENSNTYIVNGDFYTTLRKYVSDLELLTIDIDLEYTYSELDFRLRVKQLESIIYKLGHYHLGKHEQGSIPLRKCLNDLLGFRICLPNFNHDCSVFKRMCELMEKIYKIRFRNSSKGEYRATHIYFYGESNTDFPWELQIWLPEDFQSNYESHQQHKQEYIKSAKIHKDAFN